MMARWRRARGGHLGQGLNRMEVRAGKTGGTLFKALGIGGWWLVRTFQSGYCRRRRLPTPLWERGRSKIPTFRVIDDQLNARMIQ